MRRGLLTVTLALFAAAAGAAGCGPDKKVVAQVDARRVSRLARLLVDAGVARERALPRAAFLYWAWLGQANVMDPRHAALPAPEPWRAAGTTPPRTPAERELAEIWQELLDVERVGLEDNFFELGGHSLLAAKVVGRIRASLKVAVPIPLLFRQPTIRRISEFVDNTLWAANPRARAVASSEQDIEEVAL